MDKAFERHENEYENKIRMYGQEHEEFNDLSYVLGFDDGHTAGCEDATHFVASMIYEHWDDFVQYMRKHKELSEIDCIEKMVKWFTVE